MQHCINVGVDLHDRTMVLRWASDREAARAASFSSDREGQERMVKLFADRRRQVGGARVFFAYEASSQGFGLYDRLTEAGFECAVLAPTRMSRSPQQKSNKDDGRDALGILHLLRAHVLAGCGLPAVWVPQPQTRDDRELVRARLDLADKLTALKNQVQMLLKRNQVQRPKGQGKGWTRAYRAWLRGLAGPGGALAPGARAALGTLLVQMGTVEEQIEVMDQKLRGLRGQERYAAPVAHLLKLKGVGLLTAMVFLTEMGRMDRFENRRQVGSYLGLVPASYESGQAQDRKGHISRHGPGRVRRALCQAVWARVRTDDSARAAYKRICDKNPKHKKKAVVALMRRLAVRMWHRALDAQQRAPALAVA